MLGIGEGVTTAIEADHCVDYLSHIWDTFDLLSTFHRTRHQLRYHQYRYRQGPAEMQRCRTQTVTPTAEMAWLPSSLETADSPRVNSRKGRSNRLRHYSEEEYRLHRLENALWRQMSRRCTKNLGAQNPLIHPRTINWHKDADVTWLYGPLYENKKLPKPSALVTPPNEHNLKPVLKRPSNHALSQSLHASQMVDSLGIGHSADRRPRGGHVRRRESSWPRSEQVEEVVKSLRFNTNVTECKYAASLPVVQFALEANPTTAPSWSQHSDPYEETPLLDQYYQVEGCSTHRQVTETTSIVDGHALTVRTCEVRQVATKATIRTHYEATSRSNLLTPPMSPNLSPTRYERAYRWTDERDITEIMGDICNILQEMTSLMLLLAFLKTVGATLSGVETLVDTLFGFAWKLE
ncbi:hypothetical protein BZG36_04551 [Bifiguratus adelaidae]|uniref:Uncharacterized protein n=1 Tax=Bifiguratus adelaidae TaxID=1938954 RepID=A0A261XVG8_9FUNG|nr:hypothetical protein BZG36_04551 [Bifiguratus adelaidae]